MSHHQWSMLIHRRTYRDVVRQRHTHACFALYAIAFAMGLAYGSIRAIQADAIGLMLSMTGGFIVFTVIATQQLVLYGRVKRFLEGVEVSPTTVSLSRLAVLADQSKVARTEALRASIDSWCDEQERRVP